jgi:hypothetical protein
MFRSALVLLAGVLVAGVAALLPHAQAQTVERAAVVPEGTERYWVQDRLMSATVSSDVVATDRRFAGGLGYGLNLVPPAGARGLDAGAPAGRLALDNWHFGVDLQQPYGLNRSGSVAQFAMNFGGQVGDGLALSVGPTVSLGGDSTASLFSPTAGSGGFMRRLQGETGLRDYGLRGAAVYNLGDSWALTGVLGYRRSLGELGISTSDEQFYSVLGLGYRF